MVLAVHRGWAQGPTLVGLGVGCIRGDLRGAWRDKGILMGCRGLRARRRAAVHGVLEWEEGSGEDSPSLLPSFTGVGGSLQPSPPSLTGFRPRVHLAGGGEGTWPVQRKVSSDRQLSLPSGTDGRVVSPTVGRGGHDYWSLLARGGDRLGRFALNQTRGGWVLPKPCAH